MQRMKLSLACLLCLSWAGAASAQAPLESDLGVAVLEDYSGGVSYGGAYFDVRTMTGDGVGYRNGFTQLGVVYPVWMDEDMYIAPNARLMVTDTKQVGANLGGMARRYRSDLDRIFGAYAYFDIDRSVEGFNYQQFMFGVETLGEFWDARFNAYIPTSTNDNNFVRPISLSDDPVFFGNALGFTGVGLFQSAVSGIDFEVGVPLTKRTPWLRGYLGMYAYDADRNDPVGVRARIEAWISNDLSVGVNVTEDRNFGTNVNAVVDWRFAGWLPTRYFPQWTTQERMMMPVQRNWRVATANSELDAMVPGYNPETDQPYFVVHVDATNPNAGDGTFENPFNYLPASAPGADLILVQRDGTSLLNPLTGPITLSDRQRLLGEGKAHQADIYANFSGIVFPTQTITLPGFFDDGNYPYLSSLGNIVNIASNNEVSAFNMTNALGAAITNFPIAGSNNFNLNSLNIVGNNGGILLTNARGNGILQDINALDNNRFDNGRGGISIETALLPLNLVANNITSSTLLGTPQAYGMRLNANVGAITADISEVLMNNNVDGMVLQANNSALAVRLRNGLINDNSNDGVRIEGTSSLIGFDVAETFINRSGNYGLRADTTGGTLNILGQNMTVFQSGNDNVNLEMNNTTMNIAFSTAIFNESQTGSGFVLSNTGGSGGGTLNLTAVTSIANALDGLNVTGTNFTDIDATISASLFNNNDRDALSFTTATNATVDAAITGVLANESGRHGLNFDARSDSFLNIGIALSNLNDSGRLDPFGNGVNGFADDAFVNLTMLGTPAARSAQHGLFLNAINNAQVSIAVNNGNFQNSGQQSPGDAVHIVTDTGADVVLQVNNTPMNNLPPNATQRDGLHIESAGGSTLLANISNSSLANNLENAIDATVNTDAVVTINLRDVDGSNSGEDGILFNVQTAGTLNINADILDTASNSFDNSGTSGVGDGIDGFIRTGGIVNFNMEDTTFRRSADNGFRLDIAGLGSEFNGNFVRGDFSDSGAAENGLGNQDAFNILAADQSATVINLLDTPSFNTLDPAPGTQQHGLFANVTGGSSLEFFNENGNLSNNLINAINITMAGTNTVVDLTMLNSAANNSGFDGMIVDASDEAVLTAVFDNSPLNNSGSATSGNALNLLFRSGAVGEITLQNGSTAINAGNNAVLIDAANENTSVTVNAIASNFSDSNQSGLAGLDGNGIRVIAADQAFVGLNIFNTPITNTITTPNGPQQRGLLFDVSTGAELNGLFVNSTMSNHSLHGIEGTVTNTDSIAAVFLVDSSLNDNDLSGALLTATDDSTLIFGAFGDTVNNSISNNVDWGVNATVDNSTAAFFFEGTTVDGNGQDGVLITGTNNAIIFGSMIDASLSNNAVNGLSLDLTDSTADFGVTNFTILGDTVQTGVFNSNFDDNAENGIRILSDASAVTFNMLGGSASRNGGNDPANINFDNVLVRATNASDVEVQFIGTEANSSTRSGFNFVAEDSTFLAQMRAGVSAQNNDYGNGLRFVATGATTEAVLYMSDEAVGLDGSTVIATGFNNFSNNGSLVTTTGDITTINADEPLTGGGVFFLADSVDVAAVRLSGAANNNGNATEPEADRDIDNDTVGDHNGFYVNFNGPINLAAFEVATATANDNVDAGLVFKASNVVDLSQVIQPSSLTPPAVTIGDPDGGISIIDLVTTGNGGAGIEIIVSDTEIGGIVVDEVNSFLNGGDGILIQLTNVTGTPDLSILNSQFADNGGNGINLDLDNTPLGDILIQGNTTALSDLVSLFFLIDGDTFSQPFSITNNSLPGIDITQFEFDITPSGNEWDTGPNGFAFVVPANADVITGLTGINGNPWPNALPGNGLPSNQGVLDLTFNDFNAGETFLWFADADLIGSPVSAVFGNDLIDSTVSVTFSNGTVLNGTMGAVGGSPQASQFQASGGITPAADGISGNGLDGIRIRQVNGSHVASITIDDNIINNNGQSGAGNGINFIETTGSDILNLTITNNAISSNATNGVVMQNFTGGQLGTAGTPIEISNNTIASNANGDGVRFVGLDTTNALLEFNFDNNVINTNQANGVNLNLVAGAQELEASFTRNQVLANTTGNGVNVQLGNNANFTGNFGVSGDDTQGNAISGNGVHGVNVVLQGTGNYTGGFFYNNINSNQQTGVNLSLAAGDFTGNFENNNINGNVNGYGVNVAISGNGQYLGDFIDNVISANGQTGINLATLGTGNITANFTDNVVSGNGSLAVVNNNHGINLNLGTAGNFTGDFDGNTIDGNNGIGVNYVLPANSIVTSDFTDNSISGNGSHGIRLDLPTNAQFVSANFYGNNIDNNNGVGVYLTLGTGASYNWNIGDLNEDPNTFDGNMNAGVGIDMAGLNSSGTLSVVNSSFSGNRTNGGLPNFIGQGLHIRMVENTFLNPGTTIGGPVVGDINTFFNGNAGHGFSLDMAQTSVNLGMTIRNSQIDGNTLDGINITRTADAKLDNLTIESSVINNNRDGIRLALSGGNVDTQGIEAPLIIDVDVLGNDITNNRLNGINAELTADVNLDLDIDDNLIASNANSGIRVVTTFDARLRNSSVISNNRILNNGTGAAQTDRDGITFNAVQRTEISATVSDNLIAGNFRDGLRYTAATVPPPIGVANILNVTDNVFDGQITLNSFGQAGVNVLLSGGAPLTLNMTNNLITRFAGNSAATLPSASAVNSGVSINRAAVNLWSNDRSLLNATLTGNDIIGNRGSDFVGGLNLFHTDNQGVNDGITNALTMVVNMVDNNISFNNGRGVHVLNQGVGNMDVSIASSVPGNALPNGTGATSVIAQNGLGGIVVDNDSADTPINTSVNADRVNNNMFFTLLDTAVVGNGNTSASVGVDERNGVHLWVGTSQRGDFLADIQRNFMSGNTNIDFTTQSYTATNAPAVNRWDSPNFTTDPLARLGLRFQQNRGDQVQMTRAGATYSNDDIYKSQRYFFNSSSRVRNAQRLNDPMQNRIILAGQLVDNTPAPTAGAISSSGIDTLVGVNGRSLIGSRQTINNQHITASGGASPNSTISSAFGAAPAVGTVFNIDSGNNFALAGIGSSTFRTEDASVLDNNDFSNVISDFGFASQVFMGGADTLFFGNTTQSFTWDTGFVFPQW